LRNVSTLKPNTGEESKVPAESKKKEKAAISEEPEPQFRLMAGYGGTIPTRFRTPNIAELAKLKDSDPGEIFESIKTKKITEPDDIKSFVKSVIGSEKFQYFSLAPDISDLFHNSHHILLTY